MHTFVANLLMILLLVVSLLLIVLVLIQRGKGGGLAGALGGMGGQSAFGTKAGDLFTRITIGLAAFWMILCIVMVKVLGIGGTTLSEKIGSTTDQPPAATAPATPGQKPVEGQAEAPAAPEKAPAAPAQPETK